MNDPKIKAIADDICARLADQGKLIEGGWAALLVVMPMGDVPPALIGKMRNIYFAGAQHVFSSVTNIMDPSSNGDEPTEKDMRRMTSIHEELEAWVETMRRAGLMS